MIKIGAALLLAFLIGAACRVFDIPVPSPPKLIGAVLVVAMTVGYTVADLYLVKVEPGPAAQQR